jgi:FixJ family two-component response regulator
MISLPTAKRHVSRGRRRAPMEGSRVAATSLVCIVEDDASVRSATGRLMRSLGYDVLLFDSAEAYLASLHEQAHCLVCDVQMPGMSGIDLFERLQSLDRKIPIVFITAHAKATVEQRIGRQARVLVKPFLGAELAKQIEDAISG